MQLLQYACQVLAAVRRGLTRHPLDLRGSRRALEAAQVINNAAFGRFLWESLQIFLELDGEKKEGMEFLDTTLTIGKADQVAKPTPLKSWLSWYHPGSGSRRWSRRRRRSWSSVFCLSHFALPVDGIHYFEVLPLFYTFYICLLWYLYYWLVTFSS